MQVKTIRAVPILIAGGVILLVCGLQGLSIRFASPPGETKRGATARANVTQPFYFDPVNQLEWMTYDWRVKFANRFPASAVAATNLGYVECTDDTAATLADGSLGAVYGLFWPRHLYGRLVRELKTQGAKVVAFDIMLGELRPDHRKVSLPDGTSVGSDEFLAQEARHASNVVLAATTGVVPPALFRTNVWAIGDILSEKDADNILRRARLFRPYRIWQPVILRWARNEKLDVGGAHVAGGHLILPPTPDRPSHTNETLSVGPEGSVDLAAVWQKLGEDPPADQPKQAPPFADVLVWHLGVILAARELDLDLDRATIDLPNRQVVLRGPAGFERRIPTDEHGYLYIDWTLPLTDRRLTRADFEGLVAQDILRQAGETNTLQTAWKDKLVVLGSTATGGNLSDLGGTPIENETPLMTKHWNIANSIITGRFVRRSGYGEELALIVLLGVFSGLLTWRLRALSASAWVLAMLVVYVLAALVLFITIRYWIPIVLPVGGALLMTHVCMVTYRVIFEQNERRRVKAIFAKIVSPDVVNELLGQERLALGGARRSLTVFFADVRGFTKMTDENQHLAEELVRQERLTGAAAEACQDAIARETLATVNLYLATIADNIKKHDGTLDKYIGDCVMAFWGAPTPNPRHALACVRAAIDSQRAMYQLNLQRQEENRRREAENPARVASGQRALPMLATLSLGTGINTGTAIVGLMGSEAHIFNYTVFGREVNVASRLEGVSGRGAHYHQPGDLRGTAEGGACAGRHLRLPAAGYRQRDQ